jgi:hypothetical protein
MIFNFLKKLRCKHDNTFWGLSYVKCKKCGKKKIDVKQNSRLLRKHCSAMVNAAYGIKKKPKCFYLSTVNKI